MSLDLEALAQEILDIVYRVPSGRERRFTRRMAETPVKGVIARVFRLGMDVGWDKAVDRMADVHPDLRNSTVKPDSWATSWQDGQAGSTADEA